MTTSVRRVVVEGRVQGVGFRHAAVQAAITLGVTGWVRNRRDGSVEAFVQGDAAAVERFVEWCRRGPPPARVTGLSASDAEPDDALRDFSMRPSA